MYFCFLSLKILFLEGFSVLVLVSCCLVLFCICHLEQVCCEPSDSLVSGPCLVCASTLDLLGNPSSLVLSLVTPELRSVLSPFLVGHPLVLLGASFLEFLYPSCLTALVSTEEACHNPFIPRLQSLREDSGQSYGIVLTVK
jgi:hypothetical protein